MSELDKKMQKSQPDLVQSVFEAQERRNQERVEILITNALKQLKISRFKPDQATCLSLLYIAKVSPVCFSQSQNLKELLKSHLRRDNGPANVKSATKNDTILPLLASHILIACSDTPEVRMLILRRIDNWLMPNQEPSDAILFVFMLLAQKCQGDEQTVQTLIDLRDHWIPYLHLEAMNVCPDLCRGVRGLLEQEYNACNTQTHLNFLITYDKDVAGSCQALSKYLLRRPLSFECLSNSLPDGGLELIRTIFALYIKFLKELESNACVCDNQPLVYFKFTGNSPALAIDQSIIEAMLYLLPFVGRFLDDNPVEEINYINKCWLSGERKTVIYSDPELNTPFYISTPLRRRLIQSDSCEQIVSLGLDHADPNQLIELSQQFGLPISTLTKIFKRLIRLDSEDLNKLEIKDMTYYRQYLEFLSETGVQEASGFMNILEGSETKDSNVIKMVKIKVES